MTEGAYYARAADLRRCLPKEMEALRMRKFRAHIFKGKCGEQLWLPRCESCGRRSFQVWAKAGARKLVLFY